MKIYLELVFNNVENFLSTTFPVTRSTFQKDSWLALVRDYLHRHKATSPYFLEIPQKFMEFLSATRVQQNGDPLVGDPPGYWSCAIMNGWNWPWMLPTWNCPGVLSIPMQN